MRTLLLLILLGVAVLFGLDREFDTSSRRSAASKAPGAEASASKQLPGDQALSDSKPQTPRARSNQAASPLTPSSPASEDAETSPDDPLPARNPPSALRSETPAVPRTIPRGEPGPEMPAVPREPVQAAELPPPGSLGNARSPAPPAAGGESVPPSTMRSTEPAPAALDNNDLNGVAELLRETLRILGQAEPLR